MNGEERTVNGEERTVNGKERTVNGLVNGLVSGPTDAFLRWAVDGPLWAMGQKAPAANGPSTDAIDRPTGAFARGPLTGKVRELRGAPTRM